MVKQRGASDEVEDCPQAFSLSHRLHGAPNNVGEKHPGSNQINLHHAELLYPCMRLSHQASLSISDKPVAEDQVHPMSPSLVASCLWYSETAIVEMRRAWHPEPQWL